MVTMGISSAFGRFQQKTEVLAQPVLDAGRPGSTALGITALLAAMWVFPPSSTANAEPLQPPGSGTAPHDIAAASATELPSEFRMEGAPQVEAVFGDIAAYKGRIDEFSAIESSMESERRRFATAAHAVQRTLGPLPRVGPKPRATAQHYPRSGCPTNAIASGVATAIGAHAQYRMLGITYERSYRSIRDLHSLGESTGLTPDYRSRVLLSRAAYRQALSDLVEMKSVMERQLQPALKKLGCSTEALVAHANSHADPPIAANDVPDEPASTPDLPGIQARAVTFFVDNRACGNGLDVYVDATLLGRVAGGAHAAFQSLSGRHSLCLLADDTVTSCGDTGTIRTAFVHDGFRIQRSCAKLSSD